MINSEEIPIGYRFTPTDEELTTYYLRKKVEGEDMTWFNHVISEQDLYGELPPWVIFDQHGGGRGEDDHRIRYFYTRLKKKHDSGEKIHRTVGKNEEYCWDGTAKGKNIYDHRTMTVIGKRKQYSLIRSKQKKKKGIVTNESNNISKDVHETDDNGGDKGDKSFGNWIMHEYSLVNHRSSSSSNDNQNYVLCRIRMKEPPKLTTTSTTTTLSNATTDHRRRASINNSTITAPAALPSCTDHGYQNMSNQMLHGQQQQQDDHLLDAADHVAVPPLVLPTGADYQINHQDNGYLWQHPYDDQLFQQDVQQQQQQQQQQLVLMYDQEQPAAATMELVSLGSMSEWELGRGLDTSGGSESSSHDNNILDTIMNLGNPATGLDNLGDDRNNYDTILNSLKEDTVYNDLIWENHWACPFPPSQPSGSQFCNVKSGNRS